jgi:hypothetical protein
MKIGVIFTIYNCEEYLENCLQPWFDLKSEYDFVFTLNSGRFNDYIELGIPDRNGPTLKKLIDWEFDFMIATRGNNLLGEDTSRNLCLNYLKPLGCDLIFLVDGDEIYTKKQIRDILSYIESKPDVHGFSLYLKNYTIKYPLFTGHWHRPTIYRNNIYGGLGSFYFDSYFGYADGIHGIKDIAVEPIPRGIAFIDHFCWLPTQMTQDKIAYQNKRYHGANFEFPEGCRCSFEWGDNGLEFSKTFWKCREIEVPALSEYPSPIKDPSIFLSFGRSENKIFVCSENDIQNCKIIVKDKNNGDYLNEFSMDLIKHVQYWIIPLVGRDFDSDELFTGFRIELEKDGSTFHIENLHIK